MNDSPPGSRRLTVLFEKAVKVVLVVRLCHMHIDHTIVVDNDRAVIHDPCETNAIELSIRTLAISAGFNPDGDEKVSGSRALTKNVLRSIVEIQAVLQLQKPNYNRSY